MMAFKKSIVASVVSLVSLLAAGSGFAQAETLSLEPGVGSPKAGIEDVSWLEGHWRGPALGGIAEELWSAPAAGAMMGMFRLINGDEVGFYEFFVVVEENETLILKLKHFNSDLTGWEEKNEMVSFPLVKLGENAAYFDGLTYRMAAEDKLQVFVRMEGEGGSTGELEFFYELVE